MGENKNFYIGENGFKPPTMKFFIVLIVMLTSFSLIPMISAFEFDNIKSYDETIGDYGKYTIRNSVLRIPFLQLDKVIEIELKENSDICLGFDCYAEKEIVLYEKGVLISDIRFVHTNNVGQQYYANTPYTFKIKNGKDWINYKIGEVVNPGTYYLRLEGSLPDIFTSVDWQIKSNGYWLEEWAKWTSGLNFKLLAYWNMTNTTITAIPDLTGKGFDGVIIGDINEIPGNIGTAQQDTAWNNANYINISKFGLEGLNRSFTVMAWVKIPASESDNPPIISLGGTNGMDLGISGTGFAVLKKGISIDVIDTNNVADNNWHMIVSVIEPNGTIVLYFDGTNNVNGSANTEGYAGDQHTTMGESSGAGDTTLNGAIDEIGVWNRTLTQEEITQLYNSGAGLNFSDDLDVILLNPADNIIRLFGVINFTANFSTTTQNLVNTSLYVWNSTGDLTINTTEITGTSNETTLSLNLSKDTYAWNFFTCIDGGVICDFAPRNRTLTISDFTENSNTFNSTVIETATESYILNISTDGTKTVTAILIYDGNIFTSTKSGTDAEAIFTASQDIPTNIGSKNFNWNVTIGLTITSTSTQTQTINSLIFNICNATLSTRYINFSFKNETIPEELINATFISSNQYWLGLGAINKTLTFSNATENFNYEFCLSPEDKSLNVLFDIAYNNDISQQRTFKDTFSLTNTTTSKVLYLLPSSLGIFSTFKTEDPISNILTNVVSKITRTLNGVLITSTIGVTDGSGVVVFFLNPDVTYTGSFSKSGFVTNTFTFVPITDTRTVILGSTITTVTNGTEISLNTSYNILPINTTLVNNTNYIFGLNVTSSQPITLISMNITNQTGHQVAFVSNAGAGFISEIINTQNNSRMQGKFIIQTANETIIFTRVWIVGNEFVGDYSLFNQMNLFNDYEFEEFVRLFIVILIISGLMIFLTTTQITDTSESQIGAIIILIWIFSVVGWLNNPIVVAETGFAQFSKQYGIAILVTAGGSFFILRRLLIRKT